VIEEAVTTATEITYISGLAGGVQAQIDGKQDTVSTESTYQDNMITILKSFESASKGTEQFRLPFPGTLSRIDVVVETTIESSDVAELIFKNNAGSTVVGSNLTAGVLSITKGSVINTKFTTNCSANNAFSAGDTLSIESRKSTSGGTVWVILTFQRSDLSWT
jgi:hypothetical protein